MTDSVIDITSHSPSAAGFAGNFRTDAPPPPVITGLANNYFGAARIVHSGFDHGISKIPEQDAFVLAYLMKPFSQSDAPPPPPVITGLANNYFGAARIMHSGFDHGISKIPEQDAFVLAYLMKPFSQSELWVGGRPASWDPIQPGQTHFYNLDKEIRADIRDPLDFVYMYLPRPALNAFTDEHRLPRIHKCNIDTGTAFTDPVAARIARSLLPALDRPGQANQLFIDEAAFALQGHFVRRYGGLSLRHAFFRGGLRPWQERRAKEMMLAHIALSISVEDLAKECGLSRSQFFRAFKWSTGKTPHRWLSQSRVEISKELLRSSKLSVAEIARACGFNSPSHFIRVFSNYAGLTPLAWRSARLS